MKPVVIIGTGDFARIAAIYLEHDGGRTVAGFVVHEQHMDRDELLERPVTAFECVADDYPVGDYDAFVAIGYGGVNQKRAAVFAEAKRLGYDMVTYVSPRAERAPHVEIGENCFVFEDNVLQPFVRIGDDVVLWSGNHVGHDSTIEEHCFLASHVVISGHVTIGHHTFVGVNATLRDGITIAPRCIIGAGAVIMHDTEEGAVHAVRGTQAHPTKKSWDLDF